MCNRNRGSQTGLLELLREFFIRTQCQSIAGINSFKGIIQRFEISRIFSASQMMKPSCQMDNILITE